MTTPIARLLREKIKTTGPLRLDVFLSQVVGHPTLGYYATQEALGPRGDFTTAPEISPLFGEMLGLWCVSAWHRMGRPQPISLVELGPGRGTLMADALRAIKRTQPNLLTSLHVHLVEISPQLRQQQALSLSHDNPEWHDTMDTVPLGPFILIANEFFDALPIRQFQRKEEGWEEMCVDIHPETGAFFLRTFGASPLTDLLIPPHLRHAAEGQIVEVSPASWSLMKNLAQQMAHFPSIALLIDYGLVPFTEGVTLQALQQHRKISALDSVGEADITAHVDFVTLARIAQESGAAVQGPVTQENFLRSIGIEQRLLSVKTHQSHLYESVASGVERLLSPDQMGSLFKVMAVRSPSLPPLEGFDVGIT